MKPLIAFLSFDFDAKEQFVEDYAELSRENLVEPYDPSDSGQIIHMIRVGPVLPSSNKCASLKYNK